MTAPLLSAWSDELIKERLSAEISEFGSFGHGQAFDESSPPRTHVEDDSGPTSSNEILDKYYAVERQINSYQKGIQHQLGIMRADDFPDAKHDSPAARYDMPSIAPKKYRTLLFASHLLLHWEATEVRRMAPNVLSPFIAQAQTRHSAIKMDLKEAAATVFDGTWTPSIKELVSMHDTSLTRGNLASFQGDCWIGNDVVDAFCRMLQFDDESRTKLFLSPYIAEMVIRSNAKHLTHDAIVARFDPYMYAFDGSYQNVTQAKVVLLLVADKKEMVVVDLNMYSFVMPDHDCGVFIMKFMDNWSNGGLSKSIDVVKIKKYRLKLLGRLLLSSHNAHRHRFMAV
ncbi:hypothetical protein CK203_096343 [Vitis vinifera]|uniref:Ubiquitin-like protease family profile domain-containing protein n=1 Tax=Vitis vinifera TaxID=29760 RepID=A0A438F4L1_VITVI|nr:hypothetical protein CK203_096343 [Vitis vinifera]